MKYFIILLSSLAIGAVAAFSQDNPLPADSVGASQVTGTVVDTLGDPVIGASVTVKNNLQKSTMTDVDGKFTIAGLPANSVVQITYIGFSPKTVKVATGTSDYRIVMTANNSMLDEVVTTSRRPPDNQCHQCTGRTRGRTDCDKLRGKHPRL